MPLNLIDAVAYRFFGGGFFWGGGVVTFYWKQNKHIMYNEINFCGENTYFLSTFSEYFDHKTHTLF